MSVLVSRPTENDAIGNAMRPRPPRLSLARLLLDRAAARDRHDRYGDVILGAKIDRARAIGQVGE